MHAVSDGFIAGKELAPGDPGRAGGLTTPLELRRKVRNIMELVLVLHVEVRAGGDGPNAEVSTDGGVTLNKDLGNIQQHCFGLRILKGWTRGLPAPVFVGCASTCRSKSNELLASWFRLW